MCQQVAGLHGCGNGQEKVDLHGYGHGFGWVVGYSVYGHEEKEGIL